MTGNLTTTGSVGINVPSPSFKLSIKDTSTNNWIAEFQISDTNTSSLRIGVNGTIYSYYIGITK